MKTEKILMIGGPRDGIRLRPQPQPQTHLAVYSHDRGGRFETADSITTDIYTLQQFKSNDKVFQAYVHSSVKNPMEALLKGYRYHRNPALLTSRKLSRLKNQFSFSP